ncbi:MAG TPA: alpha/beta hydrolase [Candidatus Saccharimonadales bacterium]|nr:alpha/beta hydrolase [Candidatus Saccharimonadales bacterium]
MEKLQSILISSLSSIILVLGLQAIPASAAGNAQFCLPTRTPVTLSPTDPTIYHVTGQLCANGLPAGKTLQVLVHGLTYDHRYWDWPLSPEDYSYTRAATSAGYATFSIDLIGDGTSDHPADGNSITAATGAYVLHQVIQSLRAGAIARTPFSKIIAVGHSYGSVTIVNEAAVYHDEDAIILSGYAHQFPPAAFSSIQTDFYPAPQDPKFAHSGLNSTYLTTVPGTRAQLFYDTSNASQGVIALDELLKQTATTGQLGSFGDPNNFATPQITVPIMLAVGQHDYIVCDENAGFTCANSGAFLAREAPDYSPQSCLEAFVLPNSGHDINLHKNAHLWFAAATDWANRRIGPNTAHPATGPCQ